MLEQFYFAFTRAHCISSRRPTAGVTGAGAGVASAWEQKKLEARKMLAVGAADSQPSGAPSNDGERSFFTEERLVGYAENMQKVAIFQEKGAFFAISSDVLRTHC